jgi:hypothetical protein
MKRLILFLMGGLCASSASHAANIGWISFHAADNTPSSAAAGAGFTQAPDVGYTALLAANGHTVTRIVTVDDAALSAATLNALDLLIISRSVPSGHYQTDAETAFYNGLTVPTMILGGYIIRGGTPTGNTRLGYMAGNNIPDTHATTRLKAMVPSHPIFSGIALDAGGTMVNAFANSGTNGTILGPNGVAQRGISVITGNTAGGGVRLAVVAPGDPNVTGGMIIGEWLPGDAMSTSANGSTNDLSAGHRMVFLTGTREQGITSDGAGIYDLATDGAQLFLNAVSYMTSAARIPSVTVNTVNNISPGATETSLFEALGTAQDGDYIRFNIPGAGPHVIETPVGGYLPITAHNLTIDGYTQDGASANTQAILAGNNAALRIVLDSSGTDTALNPSDPSLPLHRSTRLLYPGFGDTEDAILPVVGARNFNVKGISFVSRYALDEPEDPNVYCVAFVNVPTGATGGHVNGCWFGLRPDGTGLKGGRASVATFKNGTEDASGLVIGTNGDGINDRAEFNIHAAMSLAIHLETPNVKVSGNYVNVLPSGNAFVDVDAVAREIGAVQDPGNPEASPATVEFLENANCTNVIIGIDGDGIADADERNIIANVSYSETMEFWRAADLVVVAGNYFGVGVNGVTPSPVSEYEQPDFLRFGRTLSSVRIGSNGDGISDDLEPNLIVNMSGDRFINLSQGGSGDINEIALQRNVFRNCGFPALPFADQDTQYLGYYQTVANDSSMVVPYLTQFTNGVVAGTFGAPNQFTFPFAFIDLYTVDSAALANTNNVWPNPRVHPSRWLGRFIDNGAEDLDPAPNQFAFNIGSAGLSETTYVAAAVTYSADADVANTGRAVTSPMSNPISVRPTLTIAVFPDTFVVELSWLAPNGLYVVESTESLDAFLGFLAIGTSQYAAGRNIFTLPLDPFAVGTYFRLLTQ